MTITRRRFLQTSAIAGAGFVLTPWGWAIRTASAQTILLDAAGQPKFVNSLPIPIRVDTASGKVLKAEIKEKKQKLGLFDANGKALKTEIWGYKLKGSKLTYPGATLIAQRDSPTSIKWENKLKEFQQDKAPCV